MSTTATKATTEATTKATTLNDEERPRRAIDPALYANAHSGPPGGRKFVLNHPYALYLDGEFSARFSTLAGAARTACSTKQCSMVLDEVTKASYSSKDLQHIYNSQKSPEYQLTT